MKLKLKLKLRQHAIKIAYFVYNYINASLKRVDSKIK